MERALARRPVHSNASYVITPSTDTFHQVSHVIITASGKGGGPRGVILLAGAKWGTDRKLREAINPTRPSSFPLKDDVSFLISRPLLDQKCTVRIIGKSLLGPHLLYHFALESALSATQQLALSMRVGCMAVALKVHDTSMNP